MKEVKKQFSLLLKSVCTFSSLESCWNKRTKTEQTNISKASVNKAIWHLLHHWNRQFISFALQTLKHNKRLHNAQFINHTARTIAEHKYFSRLWGFSVFTQNNMFNMFSVYVFPPDFVYPASRQVSFSIQSLHTMMLCAYTFFGFGVIVGVLYKCLLWVNLSILRQIICTTTRTFLMVLAALRFRQTSSASSVISLAMHI